MENRYKNRNTNKGTSSCIACRKKDIKKNLIRIVRENNENFVIDKKQKKNYRAMYICPNINCIKKCVSLLEKNKIKNIYNKANMIKVINNLEQELGE